jgi:hypothetical protein
LTLARWFLLHLRLIVDLADGYSAGCGQLGETLPALIDRQGEGWLSILDLLIGAAMLIVPRQLRWSSRSARLLVVCGILFVGKGLVDRGRRGSIVRVSEATIGAALLGGQYLLSEEDSSVRGSIAALGGVLLALALLRRK